MGFRCRWRWCGYTQLHGRHAHWIGLGQISSTFHRLNLMRKDLRLWLADRKTSLSERQEERPEDRKLTDCLQELAGGRIHVTSCKTTTGNQAMAAKGETTPWSQEEEPFLLHWLSIVFYWQGSTSCEMTREKMDSIFHRYLRTGHWGWIWSWEY